jgi:hypothetical protein
MPFDFDLPDLGSMDALDSDFTGSSSPASWNPWKNMDDFHDYLTKRDHAPEKHYGIFEKKQTLIVNFIQYTPPPFILNFIDQTNIEKDDIVFDNWQKRRTLEDEEGLIRVYS